MNTRYRAAAVTLALAVAASSSCQPPEAQGTVTAKIHHGKWRYLAVRSGGRTTKIRVGLLSRAWRHCHTGDPYPQCGES